MTATIDENAVPVDGEPVNEDLAYDASWEVGNAG